MGRYINNIGISFETKVDNLKQQHSATVIEKPDAPIPDLVCVVDNGAFSAAAHIYDQGEYDCFSDSADKRRKVWLVVPDAATLAS